MPLNIFDILSSILENALGKVNLSQESFTVSVLEKIIFVPRISIYYFKSIKQRRH